jgi:transcriptional regulator with XRE-family HTH domain
MPKKLKYPDIVNRLKAWREANGLSQRGACEVMAKRDFPLKISTLRTWEQEINSPGHFAAKALHAFLEKHPVIRRPPSYKSPPVPEDTLSEILKLRQNGDTLEKIAGKFEIDQSTVSRICSDNPRTRRRAKELNSKTISSS